MIIQHYVFDNENLKLKISFFSEGVWFANLIVNEV